MSMSAKLRRAPLRAVTGAFILGSGVDKLSADEETAKGLHGLATGTYPFLGKVNPKLFAKGLGAGEIAVGAALLTPFVSPVVAGAALVGFSGALLNLYWNTDGLHEPGNLRPTQAGIPIAKDIWMFGIGAGLVADGLLEPAHDKHVEVAATLVEKKQAKGRAARRAKRRAKRANSDLAKQVRQSAQSLESEARKRAEKASKKAQKKADKAGKQLEKVRKQYGPLVTETAKHAQDAARDAVDQYGPVVADRAKQARDAARDAVDHYGPVVADRAKQARDAATDLVDEYRPVVEKSSQRAVKQSRRAAKQAAKQAGKKVRTLESSLR